MKCNEASLNQLLAFLISPWLGGGCVAFSPVRLSDGHDVGKCLYWFAEEEQAKKSLVEAIEIACKDISFKK